MFVFLEKSLLGSIPQIAMLILATIVPAKGSLQSQEQKLSKQISIIKKLPYTIAESGHYYLPHDFDATNLDGFSYAIEITANDVDLDLGHHVLTLNSCGKGICASHVSNLSIHHGTIMGYEPTGDADSRALTLFDVTHGSFEKLSILNSCIGVDLYSCTDQLIVDCKFDSNYFSMLNESSKGLTLRGCKFNSVLESIGILSGEDFIIHHCELHTSVGRGIALWADSSKQIANVEIDGCKLHTEYTLASLGISLNGNITNAKIRNCTFSNNGQPSPAISCSGCVDVVVEGCSTPLNKIETKTNGTDKCLKGFRIW